MPRTQMLAAIVSRLRSHPHPLSPHAGESALLGRPKHVPADALPFHATFIPSANRAALLLRTSSHAHPTPHSETIRQLPTRPTLYPAGPIHRLGRPLPETPSPPAPPPRGLQPSFRPSLCEGSPRLSSQGTPKSSAPGSPLGHFRSVPPEAPSVTPQPFCRPPLGPLPKAPRAHWGPSLTCSPFGSSGRPSGSPLLGSRPSPPPLATRWAPVPPKTRNDSRQAAPRPGCSSLMATTAA